ncbi:MAG: hydrogenase expression/formation protein HypE [Caldiserica bacterium]|nr:hydrogenase expression/formation protein HypE [Caldisericota bacterium]
MNETFKLSEGGGGGDSRLLIKKLLEMLGNDSLSKLDDSGVFALEGKSLAMTTDGFVVKPIFFPGGNIGKLSVCGTLNDLAVMAAKPLAISLALIIAEGFPKEDFEKILDSIKDTLGNVPVVTGDTKVVESASADGIFITTTGIGVQIANPSGTKVKPGDALITTGSIGRHGACIMASRNELGFAGQLESDVKLLSPVLMPLFEEFGDKIHACRDITRGGLSAMIHEFAESSGVGMEITESSVPVDPDVKGLCLALGLDPMHLACEGRALLTVDPSIKDAVVSRLLASGEKLPSIVGCTTDDHKGMAYLTTKIGGKRILEPPAGEMLPRIC